jgi:kynureninase
MDTEPHRPITRDACLARDRADPLAAWRARFALPEGAIYLDGNSLGALPRHVPERVAETVATQWGEHLITSWNRHGWFDMPRKVGEKIGRLIGAPPGTVAVCDTISVNLYKLLAGALSLTPERRVILSDTGNFPSDLYIAQGLIAHLDHGHELRLVDPEDVASHIGPDTAVVMLTESDYRSARLHDMRAITGRAHAAGALVIWDLAHTAGAMPIDLEAANADFAVGCTYKYLNGGPGAPAFLYVRADLQDRIHSPLCGWWGHESPFAFDTAFRPAPGIARQQCGTQGILSLAALDAAMDVWEGVDLTELRRKSMALCQIFIGRVEALTNLKLSGPRALAERGSHVSFHCPEGYAIMQALIARGITGDFRAPDLIRFGFQPLYNSHCDAFDAAEAVSDIVTTGAWNDPRFTSRKAVT